MEQSDKNMKMYQLGTIIGETMIYAIFIIGSIIFTFLFAPVPVTFKILFVVFGGAVSYDIYKGFIHVKWVLWKQDLETPEEFLETNPDNTKKA